MGEGLGQELDNIWLYLPTLSIMKLLYETSGQSRFLHCRCSGMMFVTCDDVLETEGLGEGPGSIWS